MLNISQYLFPHLVRYFLFLSLFCFSIIQITQTRVIFHIPGHDTLGFIALTVSHCLLYYNQHSFYGQLASFISAATSALLPCLLLSLSSNHEYKETTSHLLSTHSTDMRLLLFWRTYAMPSCLSGFLSLSGTPPSQGANPINVQLDSNSRSQQEWALCRWANDKAPASHLA